MKNAKKRTALVAAGLAVGLVLGSGAGAYATPFAAAQCAVVESQNEVQAFYAQPAFDRDQLSWFEEELQYFDDEALAQFRADVEDAFADHGGHARRDHAVLSRGTPGARAKLP